MKLIYRLIYRYRSNAIFDAHFVVCRFGTRATHRGFVRLGPREPSYTFRVRSK